MTQKPISRKQNGFTLLELVVVVGVLGVLIAVLAPNVSGSKDGANSTLLLKTAQDAGNNWMLINQACGTSTDVSTSPVILATKTAPDVVFGGVANVAAGYTACYNQARVRAMTDVAQPKSGGGWTVAGYTTTFAGGGTAAMQIQYAAVPDALALMMAQKYAPSLSALDAAGDSASTVIQYGTPTSGARTVTVLRNLN